MYGKIKISGIITVENGMHIGGSSQFAAIGSVDSPVIRDRQSDLPMIPGSSLKGKMRTLLAKQYSQSAILKQHEDDPEIVLRLFGNSKKGDRKRESRLIFSDMILSNMDELREMEIHSATEIKFENSINRITAIANPRQIERVIRGSQFPLDLIYNVMREEEIIEDMGAIKQGFELLQYDYLGGNGTRGYGKVKLSELAAKCVVGDIAADIMDQCNEIMKGE
nr:type III-A CRISPR-associated RAMP protein Csm3 [uncultured Anaerostipes sp.]